MERSNFFKYLKQGAAVGLLMLPVVSQAGLMVNIDNTATVGTDFSISDGDAGDINALPGILSFVYSSGGGSSFNITADSGSPDEWILTDIQLNSELVAGTNWEVTVWDDSYSSGGAVSSLFETRTTPTQINRMTADLVSTVNGTEIMNQAGLPEGVQSSEIGSAALSDPFDITHTFTFSSTLAPGSGQTGRVTLDTTTEAVPEPTSLSLLGFALLGLAWIRRKYFRA